MTRVRSRGVWYRLTGLAAAVAVGHAGATLAAQTAAQTAPQTTAPAVYQRLAPIDLTGTWVSVVSEDWDLRMITPPKGFYYGLPINEAARKVGETWDPARDQATGNACRAYGAGNVMRIPGRIRIGWQDNGNTLRIDTDAGEQTRLLRFAGPPRERGPASWQGDSMAAWEYAGGFDPNAPPGRAGRGGRGGGPQGPAGGALKVVTTNLRPGYIRKNGVPYSAEAVVSEYFNVHTDPTTKTDWLVVTTTVHDPMYLVRDYITSTNFKKEPDGSKFRPTPCSAQ